MRVSIRFFSKPWFVAVLGLAATPSLRVLLFLVVLLLAMVAERRMLLLSTTASTSHMMMETVQAGTVIIQQDNITATTSCPSGHQHIAKMAYTRPRPY
jgi:hypothetical protein